MPINSLLIQARNGRAQKIINVGDLLDTRDPNTAIAIIDIEAIEIDPVGNPGITTDFWVGRDASGNALFATDVLDSNGQEMAIENIAGSPRGSPPTLPGGSPTSTIFSDDFDSPLTGYTIYRGNDPGGDLTTAEIEVSVANGRYKAHCKQNVGNRLLWFNGRQGLAYGRLISGDFEAIATNIGVENALDSQLPPQGGQRIFCFSGLQVHHPNLQTITSTHLVPGHRGSNDLFTAEGKTTENGISIVNSLPDNSIPNCRADIRVVRSGDQLSWFYRLPANERVLDNWIPYVMPAPHFDLSDLDVYVNLITYGQESNAIPFWGTCDRLEINQ